MRDINELSYIFRKYEGKLEAHARSMGMFRTILNDISKKISI